MSEILAIKILLDKAGEKSENRLFTFAFGKDQEIQLLYFSIDISLILVIIAFVLKNANDFANALYLQS